MIKRLSVFFIAMLLICSTAFAENNGLSFSFIIQQESSDSSVSFDADLSDHSIRILSDLFPSYYVSVPTNEITESFLFNGLFSSFSSFSLPDMPFILTQWISGLEYTEKNGIFAADAFNEAAHVKAGMCTIQDISHLVSKILNLPADKTDLYHAFFEIVPYDLSELSVPFGVFDSGNFFSLSGLISENIVFTLSADFSDPSRFRFVWGYPENGQNFYWETVIACLSHEEIEIHCAFFSDKTKSGFRNAYQSGPVFKEKWSVHLSEDRKEMVFDGVITPSEKKSAVSIHGYSKPLEGQILDMELRFDSSLNTIYHFSVTASEKEYHYDNLQEVQINEVSENSATMLGFSGELTLRMLSVYSALIRSLPEEYADIFVNKE